MTALNSPIPMHDAARQFPQQIGRPVDDFVHRLSYPAKTEATRPVGALFLSLISFGLLPLLIWPTRWSEFADRERRDLLGLIDWWRRRTTPGDAKALEMIAGQLRPRPMLMVLPWLAAGFVAVLIITPLAQGYALDRIWNLTFEHHRNRWAQFSTPLEDHLYSLWIWSLCLGYFCQWYAVRSHSRVVGSLVKWANRVGQENGMARIETNPVMLGLNVLWILLAIGFCVNNAWWAIPMALAGAMQRRYVTRSSPEIRMALARQARDGFAAVPTSGGLFCSAGHCGARLPSVARFCPRCGTGVVG